MSPAPARKEKCFVQTARVLAWLLAGSYALLWASRVVYVIAHTAEILAWFDHHGLQSSRQAGIFLILPFTPDFVIGIPMVLLFGFVRVQAQKKEPIQPPQHNAGNCPSARDSPATETPSLLGPRG